MDGSCCDSFDPTLQSCCDRAREQEQKVNTYKQKLSISDPSSVRSRIAAEAVVRNPARLQDAGSEDEACGLGDSDDEVLEMLRRRRLEELKGDARRGEDGGTATGVMVIDELEGNVLALLGAKPLVLCALIRPEFSRKNDLIECLHSAAASCSVIACWLQPHSALPGVLGWHDPTTVVLLLRNDTVVGSVAVLEEGWRDHDLATSLKDILARSTGNADGVDHEDDVDDIPVPCAVCGRRYLHTHIGS